MSKIRIRKRGNTYSYSFDISKNPRRMKEKGGFATEDDAFDAGVKAYTDWKSGNIGITSEKVKLRDYLAAWLENVVRPNVKRTTYASYRDAVNARILPHIGGIDVQELRPRDVDMWVQSLAKKGLSYGTIRQTKSSALHRAKVCRLPRRTHHCQSRHGDYHSPQRSAKSHATRGDYSAAVCLHSRRGKILPHL